MRRILDRYAPSGGARAARSASAVAPRARDDSAVALTEFALVLPLLMLLLLAMLDFGKAFNYWIDQTHLANMGARWAVVNKNPGAASGLTLQEYIASLANTEELRTGGTTSIPTSGDAVAACISFPTGAAAVGEPVEVKVQATYHWLGFITENIGILTTDITGTATMRLEQNPTNYAANAC